MKKGNRTYMITLYAPASFDYDGDKEYYEAIRPDIGQVDDRAFWELSEDEARFICDNNKVYSIIVDFDDDGRSDFVRYIDGNEEHNRRECAADEISPTWVKRLFNVL